MFNVETGQEVRCGTDYSRELISLELGVSVEPVYRGHELKHKTAELALYNKITVKNFFLFINAFIF